MLFRLTLLALLSNEAIIAFKVTISGVSSSAGSAGQAIHRDGHFTREEATAGEGDVAQLEADADNTARAAEFAADRIVVAVTQCLSTRMKEAETDDWKLPRLHKVRQAEIVTRLVKANISLKEFGVQWEDDVPTIEATKMAGRQAAEEIAHREFEETIHKTLSGSNLSQAAVEEFASQIEKMAEMCGQGAEGKKLAEDELKLLKGNKNLTAMESTVAHELGEYVEEMCQVQVMDVDFFVQRLGNVEDCSELIGLSLLTHVRKEAQKLDFYAKSSLVLHNKENGVGHHFVKLLKGQGHSELRVNAASFKSLLHNATQKSMEHLPTMGRLRLLDMKHFEHLHGYKVETYCAGHQTGKAAQWVLDSPEIQRYNDCLCARQQPSLLCDAQHLEELETIRPEVTRRLALAKNSVNKAALLQVAESLKSKGAIGLGPCGDVTSLLGGMSCSFCVSGMCMDQGGGIGIDAIANFAAMIRGPSSCVSGSCSLCMGLKPGDPLMFVLSVGISASKCNSKAAMFTSFHLWAGIDLCIGGLLGEIADAIGWGSCSEIATVKYYPFISKLTLSLKLPVWVPPPLGVSAGIEVNLNLGDLTPAVKKYCAGKGHKHYNCLQSMYDARGPTGVSMGVDVLVGVKIPVLGTVGKWVRILGFDVAEKDRSRELAMNAAGVTVEYIGSNPHGGQKCGKTFSGVNCVGWAGNLGFRANTKDTHGDKFWIRRNPKLPNDARALCVRRTDHRNAGWAMELELACKVHNQRNAGGILIPLGHTQHEKKCVMPPEPVKCPWWAGNPTYRLGFDKHDDRFKIEKWGDRICGHRVHRRRRRRRHRRRRRNSNGWDMELTIECPSANQPINYLVQDINIGKSSTNMKCILPTYRLECDQDAGNHLKRANNNRHGDSFNIWNSHDGHLCARRTDSRSGWAMDLRIQCKQYEKAWGKVRVKFGKSHRPWKCVHPPLKKIWCAPVAANREYRFTHQTSPDSFIVSWNGKRRQFCVDRTDKWSGWGMNLEIDCVVPL